MACRSCGASSPIPPQRSQVNFSNRVQQVDPGPCDYTNDMLKDFNNKLVWFKNKALYVKYGVKAGTLNKYIGIVLTSLNISDKCMYKNILDQAAGLVDLIVSIQAEQNV
jgi:hypothetical protein